jgi:hypothetical protein
MNLGIAIRCGWRYEWVTALDHDVHQILIEELTRVDEERARV